MNLKSPETKPFILHCRYNDREAEFFENQETGSLVKEETENHKHWFHFCGLAENEIINRLNLLLPVHPLVLEDVLHTSQRAKMEDYGDHLYIVCRVPEIKEGAYSSKQLSFILKDNLLISISESSTDIEQILKEKLLNPASDLRKKGEDFLLYRYLDFVTDRYFNINDLLIEEAEMAENLVLKGRNRMALYKIQNIRSKLIHFKKDALSLRDMIGTLYRSDISFFEKKNEYFIRDLYDHSLRITESLDTGRELLNSSLELYHSLSGNRMNEVMKTLTVISTIFIPLTFIVGIYGMNFQHMPELEMRYGYPAVMMLMLILTAGMIIYFYKKKWF
jgi:magnesium transporter